MSPRKSQTSLPPRVPFPQTPETAHAWIRANGICVSELARTNHVSRAILVDLLRGQLRGLRGSAHKGAIVLGLKADPVSLVGTAR